MREKLKPWWYPYEHDYLPPPGWTAVAIVVALVLALLI